MGLFSSSSSSTAAPTPPPPKHTADGAYEAPDRTQRDRCWAARDAFFSCLDAAGIVDSIRDKEGASKACARQDEDLKRDCASSWVTYFKQRRVMEHKKKAMLEGLEKEGAKPMGDGVQGSAPGVQPPK